MEKHTPLIRLQAARTAYNLAHEACPHWDYEGPGGMPSECCYALAYAKDELRLARKAVEKKG